MGNCNSHRLDWGPNAGFKIAMFPIALSTLVVNLGSLIPIAERASPNLLTDQFFVRTNTSDADAFYNSVTDLNEYGRSYFEQNKIAVIINLAIHAALLLIMIIAPPIYACKNSKSEADAAHESDKKHMVGNSIPYAFAFGIQTALGSIVLDIMLKFNHRADDFIDLAKSLTLAEAQAADASILSYDMLDVQTRLGVERQFPAVWVTSVYHVSSVATALYAASLGVSAVLIYISRPRYQRGGGNHEAISMEEVGDAGQASGHPDHQQRVAHEPINKGPTFENL